MCPVRAVFFRAFRVPTIASSRSRLSTSEKPGVIKSRVTDPFPTARAFLFSQRGAQRRRDQGPRDVRQGVGVQVRRGAPQRGAQADRRARTEENQAFVNAFEFVEDVDSEFVHAAKKAKTEVGAAPVAVPPTSGRRTQSIASLNPYMGATGASRRSSRRQGNVRTFRNAKGEGKVMTVEFVDEAGTAIQATVWKDAIDKYDAVLEVGKVYYVAKGSLRPANRQYSSCNNDYEMSLDGRCEIEPCLEPVDLPRWRARTSS